MQFNVSAIEDYLACPTLWVAKHVAGRAMEGSSPALAFGIAWHKLMEEDPSALEAALNPPEDELPGPLAQFPELVRAGVAAWKQWLADWRPELGEAELTLAAPLGRHTLFGRLDRIVKWNGKWWHLQHKTVAPHMAEVRQKLAAASYHEQAYRCLAEYGHRVEGDDPWPGLAPWGGTLLVQLVKLPKTTRSGKACLANGDSPLRVTPLAVPRCERTLGDLAATMDAMAHLAGRLQTLEATAAGVVDHHLAPQCRISCHRWNRLCPYFDVCDPLTKTSIESFPQVDPLERYKEQQQGG